MFPLMSKRTKQLRKVTSWIPKICLNKQEGKTIHVIVRLYFKVIIRRNRL